MKKIESAVMQRLEDDLAHIDDITFLAAQILYRIEAAIDKRDFNPRKLKEDLPKQLKLDPTRKLLFERAMDVYIAAIDFTSQDERILEELLYCSSLNLEMYEGITACFDPSRPGVILIKLQSQADAIQFDKDIEPLEVKDMRIIAERDGFKLHAPEDDVKGFVGKSTSLRSLGIDDDLPILGVIVVREDADDKEGVADHEYAHAQYETLVKPFVHKYLSAMDESPQATVDRLRSLPIDIREKLLMALGSISTDREKKVIVRQKNVKAIEVLATLQEMGLGYEPAPEDIPDHNIEKTLREERSFLDELRAYAFSHDVIDPNNRITPLKMAKAPDNDENGYIDPQMAQRFLELHLLLLKSRYVAMRYHRLMLCILATSQTLSQAIRLVGAEVNAYDREYDSEDEFKKILRLLGFIANKPTDKPEFYSIGEVTIPRKKVLVDLLPPRDKFELAVQKFNLQDDELVAIARQLYNE